MSDVERQSLGACSQVNGWTQNEALEKELFLDAFARNKKHYSLSLVTLYL